MKEIEYPNNIAMIRRMRGLTQAYVAEQIGVSRPKYIDIEKGLSELTVSQVEKLKALLEVDFEDLLGIDTGRLDYKKFLRENNVDDGGALGDNMGSRDIGGERGGGKINSLKLFEDKLVRSVWDEKEEKWWFSVVDVVGILTESNDAGAYWRKLKQRLKAEGVETVTICHGLKMEAADGKMRIADVADTEQIFRIIQSVPSKKAEPFKQWLARVGKERIDQMVDPERSVEQALRDYKRLGYSDNWINQRLKSIEVRKDLTDTWDAHGLKAGQEYATLTDIIYQTWAGKTAKEYKELKGLKKENLRDNMTNEELVLNMLAELSTTSITKARNPQGLEENADCAVAGGDVARVAREKLEAETGRKVVTARSDQTKSIPFPTRTGAYPITAEERIEEIKATFALEDMPLTEENIQELRDIEAGKTTTEEARRRILAEIKRRHE